MPTLPSASLATEVLQVVTRKQTLSWNHFKQVFDVLRARGISDKVADETTRDSPKNERFQVQVVLESLGHVDFHFGERPRVEVRPATLSRLPKGGLPCAVLCGARDATTRDQVQKVCNSQGVQLQAPQLKINAFALEPLLLQSSDLQSLENVARELQILWEPTPLAWQSAHLSPSLEELLEVGREALGAHLSESDYRVHRFNPACCEFEPVYASDFAGQAGDFLTYVPLKGGLNRHLWIERDETGALRWVPLDLSWGRYAALRLRHFRALVYDERRCLLAVPRGAPLPTPLARAAALCSGMAPALRRINLLQSWPPESFVQSSHWNFYHDVPLPIAQIIGEKLGQTFVGSSAELSRVLKPILSSL